MGLVVLFTEVSSVPGRSSLTHIPHLARRKRHLFQFLFDPHSALILMEMIFIAIMLYAGAECGYLSESRDLRSSANSMDFDGTPEYKGLVI